jgi:hypothetical protein
MPLCEQTTGWWLWKKSCERWADAACANCGGRFCATHLRHVEGAMSCRACSTGDDLWDSLGSCSFSGSKHGSGNTSDSLLDTAGDTNPATDTGTGSLSDSGGSDSGGGSSD